MNNMIILCLQFVLLATTFKFYECYPSGAPVGVCDNLLPSADKHGKPPQTSKSPFELKLVTDNRSVNITIASQDQRAFRGFAIQARPANGTVGAIGTFSGDNTVSQTMKCFGSKDSGITHKDNKDKHSVTVKWMAPDSDKDIEVIFFGTVVKTKEEFWTNITSEKIVISGSHDSSGSSGDHSNHNHPTDAKSKDLSSDALNNSFNMFLIFSLISVLVFYIH